MSRQRHAPVPWYRQFWPWFLIALPASVVVAGLVTVFIAFNNADTLVNDDYYKDGLAINQRLARDETAAAMGLEARVTFDRMTGEVVVDLEAGEPVSGRLQLLLFHPVDKGLDRTLDLASAGGGRYRADLAQMPRHRYYLRLRPALEPDWRLNGEIDLGASAKALLTPDV